MTAQHNRQTFATPTIARIYAQQGKLSQSRDVYRALLAEKPSPELEAELAEVENKIKDQENNPKSSGDSLLVEISKDNNRIQLLCRWSVHQSGINRAAMVLGSSGKLTLRVLGYPEQASNANQDYPINENEGKIELDAPQGANFITAAIGLLSDKNQFVSIAHAELIQL